MRSTDREEVQDKNQKKRAAFKNNHIVSMADIQVSTSDQDIKASPVPKMLSKRNSKMSDKQ